MTRLEIMCRTAITFAPIWGEAWAVEHVRIALQGDSDSTTWERGRRLNRRAELGSRVLQLRGRLAELEKAARKTPPRTLIEERRKVEAARVALPDARVALAVAETEYARLKAVESQQGGEGT